jgi:hypothetical protein
VFLADLEAGEVSLRILWRAHEWRRGDDNNNTTAGRQHQQAERGSWSRKNAVAGLYTTATRHVASAVLLSRELSADWRTANASLRAAFSALGWRPVLGLGLIRHSFGAN